MIKKFAAWMVVPIMMLMPAFASAELVQVQMDAAGTGTFTGGGYTISRSFVNLFGNSVSDLGAAGYTADGLSIFQVTYSVAGTGGYGGFFDAGKGGDAPFITTNPNESAVFDGFQFDFESTGTGQVTVGTNTQTFGVGSNSLVFRDFEASPSINQVSFVVTQNGDGSFSFGSVSAVPEPASLLLVGSVVGGLGMIRRRRK